MVGLMQSMNGRNAGRRQGAPATRQDALSDLRPGKAAPRSCDNRPAWV